MATLTFAEYKQKVSIIQAAVQLGYKYNRLKGKTTPNYVKTDGTGAVVDSIYIKNPVDNANMGYFRHALAGRQTGDLITFIRENVREFPEYSAARNETDAVNRILARLASVEYTPEQQARDFADFNRQGQKPFELDRYDRMEGTPDVTMKWLSRRRIDSATAAAFAEGMEVIVDRESERKIPNLAFPYRIPGEERIVGYEVRGYGRFKAKADGTDSTRGCWTVKVGDPFAPVGEVHIAESAYDAMAWWQVNRERVSKDTALVFASFGGAFSSGQFLGLVGQYPEAQVRLHFDNDLNGRVYDCRAAALMHGKTLKLRQEDGVIHCTLGERQFNIPEEELTLERFSREGKLPPGRLAAQKAPAMFKDWNEVLMVEEGTRAGLKAAAERLAGERRGR